MLTVHNAYVLTVGQSRITKNLHTRFVQPFAPYVFPSCYGHSPNGGFFSQLKNAFMRRVGYLPLLHIWNHHLVLSATSSLSHKGLGFRVKGFLPPSNKDIVFFTLRNQLLVSEVRTSSVIGISLWQIIHILLSIPLPSTTSLISSILITHNNYSIYQNQKSLNTSSMVGTHTWLTL